jgi:hypothetical protein
MSENCNFERINSDKVREKIIQDGRDAGRQAIEKEVRRLSETHHFDPSEVTPLIRKGVGEAAS